METIASRLIGQLLDPKQGWHASTNLQHLPICGSTKSLATIPTQMHCRTCHRGIISDRYVVVVLFILSGPQGRRQDDFVSLVLRLHHSVGLLLSKPAKPVKVLLVISRNWSFEDHSAIISASTNHIMTVCNRRLGGCRYTEDHTVFTSINYFGNGNLIV